VPDEPEGTKVSPILNVEQLPLDLTLATGGIRERTLASRVAVELAPRGNLVSGLHLGFTATPMTKGIDAPMNDAADVVRTALSGADLKKAITRFLPTTSASALRQISQLLSRSCTPN